MYAKLVCQANNNLQRVHTRRDPKRLGLFDPKSAVAITSRRSKTLKDGSVVLKLQFADGKAVEVTYRNLD